MLGVLGFIPAFDTYFKRTFNITSFNVDAINKINAFYKNNKGVIDKLSSEIFVKDFHSENNTDIHYPKAKIIDMYGFIIGQKTDNS